MGRNKLPSFVLAAAVVVGAFVLAGVPLAALALPLILLACPLMMIFMMRGMDHGGGQGGQGDHSGGCHGGHAGHEGTAEHQGYEDHAPTSRPFGKGPVR